MLRPTGRSLRRGRTADKEDRTDLEATATVLTAIVRAGTGQLVDTGPSGGMDRRVVRANLLAGMGRRAATTDLLAGMDLQVGTDLRVGTVLLAGTKAEPSRDAF